jgi:energy-coupling factor transport system permease protein
MEQALYFKPERQRGFYLDPRTKVLFMATLTTLLFFAYENIVLVIFIAAVPLILLFINKQRKIALIYGGLFVLGILASYIKNTVVLPQVLNAILILLIALVVRLFPTFMLGYYIIKSTKVSEFVTAMHRWHISEKLIIPITVVFRFIPTIQEESRYIADAMKMRQIQFGTKKFFKNPTSILEYKIIPLMISIVKIGEELSAAALTRGLGSPNKRTNISIIGFGFYDILILIIAIFLTIWTFY